MQVAPAKDGAAAIVSVSSGAHRRCMTFDDLHFSFNLTTIRSTARIRHGMERTRLFANATFPLATACNDCAAKQLQRRTGSAEQP